MASVYQDGDNVCLDLEPAPSDQALFSIRTCDWLVDAMRYYGGKAATSRPGPQHVRCDVQVDGITDGRRVLIRLRFGRSAEKFSLSPSQAVALADLVQRAARKMEANLRWQEERLPACLVR